MQITFWGGVRTVTGSMHFLEAAGRRILLDCGLFQGHRSEANYINSHFPFDAASLQAVIISHAHLDHTGNLPTLIKRGFNGPIYSTFATRDLAAVMLQDSAHIQERDAEFLNKRNSKKSSSPIYPLYTVEEAQAAMPHFVGYSYGRKFDLSKRVHVTFYDAGHILGSALTLIEVEEDNQKITLAYVGDLGRDTLPILRDPYQIEDVDYLIIESTYGGRTHEPIEATRERLAAAINETARRGGKIIVPAFSVGRTQELVYELHQLVKSRQIPELPIFVDSPLSANVTEVFKLHPECYDQETKKMLSGNQNPFGFDRLTYIQSIEDSKALNALRYPAVIISASGMCEAGRILHHLANNIEDPKNTILIVGYQAENTLGKRLVEHAERVKIFGEEHPVRAQVVVMNGYSAHAGAPDLEKYILAAGKKARGIFLVHGDMDQAQSLAERLKKKGLLSVYIPEQGQSFTLN